MREIEASCRWRTNLGVTTLQSKSAANDRVVGKFRAHRSNVPSSRLQRLGNVVAIKPRRRRRYAALVERAVVRWPVGVPGNRRKPAESGAGGGRMAVDVEGPVDRVEAAMTDADASLASGETKCLNCGEVLLGAYCRACGQKGGAPPLHFHDFVQELMHELLHFDSKIWRTLKLLVFSPGTLTREIIAGSRVRYVGAVRLFLVSSVVLFGLLAFSAHHAETEE
jgi:hypothetical protein